MWRDLYKVETTERVPIGRASTVHSTRILVKSGGIQCILPESWVLLLLILISLRCRLGLLGYCVDSKVNCRNSFSSVKSFKFSTVKDVIEEVFIENRKEGMETRERHIKSICRLRV